MLNRNQKTKHFLDLTTLRVMMAEFAIAVNQLHELEISHHDIKADNIAINASGHVVLIDLGIAERYPIANKYRKDWRDLGEVSYSILTNIPMYSESLTVGVERKIRKVNPMPDRKYIRCLTGLIELLCKERRFPSIGTLKT